jgi:hypothetical protein
MLRRGAPTILASAITFYLFLVARRCVVFVEAGLLGFGERKVRVLNGFGVAA